MLSLANISGVSAHVKRPPTLKCSQVLIEYTTRRKSRNRGRCEVKDQLYKIEN